MAYVKNQCAETAQPCDKRFLDELCRKNQRKLVCICFRYTRNWEDAREIAQDAFLKAYRSLGGFESRSQPMTWITRIAINECLNHLAKRGRQRLHALHFLHAQEADREDRNYGQEYDDRRAVSNLFRLADPVTCRVLRLIMDQGLNQTQIAAVLGLSRVAITRRLTRFRGKALRRGPGAEGRGKRRPSALS